MPMFRRRVRDAGFGAISFRVRRAYVSHFSAQAAVEAVAQSKGDLALVPATSSRTPWWIALEAKGARRSSRGCRSSSAPTIRRRCRYSWYRGSPTAPW